MLSTIAKELSELITEHRLQIAYGMIAAVLFIYGNDINSWIRRHVKFKHFFARLAVFVVICAFGYGAATVFLANILAEFLYKLDGYSLAPVVLLTFIIIGILAERRNQM